MVMGHRHTNINNIIDHGTINTTVPGVGETRPRAPRRGAGEREVHSHHPARGRRQGLQPVPEGVAVVVV